MLKFNSVLQAVFTGIFPRIFLRHFPRLPEIVRFIHYQHDIFTVPQTFYKCFYIVLAGLTQIDVYLTIRKFVLLLWRVTKYLIRMDNSPSQCTIVLAENFNQTNLAIVI